MPFSVELRFDPASESRIFEIWKDAADFHGSRYLLENGVIPHLALVVGDAGLREVFGGLEVPQAAIRLSGAGFFGDGEVAYLRAEIPPEIRTFQQVVHDIALGSGARMDPCYQPDNWIPHCTIAQKCRTRRNEPCFGDEIDARIHSLILVEYPPTTLIAEKPLNPGP